MISTNAFPLQWPVGQKRSSWQSTSRFKVITFARVRDEIINQLKLMRVSNVVISTNIPLRNDGLPYATFAKPRDNGAAVYFFHKGKQMVFACDKWNKIEDNLQSINKTIEAVRGIERWGSSEMMERAFNGFAQIEAPTKDWWTILDVSRTSSINKIKDSFMSKARISHPDMGGSSIEMAALNNAYDEARKEKGF